MVGYIKLSWRGEGGVVMPPEVLVAVAVEETKVKLRVPLDDSTVEWTVPLKVEEVGGVVVVSKGALGS
jgi:hypothetical protein